MDGKACPRSLTPGGKTWMALDKKSRCGLSPVYAFLAGSSGARSLARSLPPSLDSSFDIKTRPTHRWGLPRRLPNRHTIRIGSPHHMLPRHRYDISSRGFRFRLAQQQATAQLGISAPVPLSGDSDSLGDPKGTERRYAKFPVSRGSWKLSATEEDLV